MVYLADSRLKMNNQHMYYDDIHYDIDVRADLLRYKSFDLLPAHIVHIHKNAKVRTRHSRIGVSKLL